MHRRPIGFVWSWHFYQLFSLLLICFNNSTLYYSYFHFYFTTLLPLTNWEVLKSAIKSLWTRYSDFRALLLVTIWCTCQSLNKFLAPLPGILFSHLILYQFVSPILLFLAYSVSIFSLLLFFLSFLYNCTSSAFLFLCDLGLHLETWSLSTWKSKPLVGVTTLQEEEGNRTPKEAVTHHLLSLHITLKWTGNRHEESP